MQPKPPIEPGTMPDEQCTTEHPPITAGMKGSIGIDAKNAPRAGPAETAPRRDRRG